MDATLSPADPRTLRTLVEASDSVELKLVVPERAGRRVLTELGVDLFDAQLRHVFFLDTPALALSAAGIIVRVRRTKHAKDDSVVKLRPAQPAQLASDLLHRNGIKVEIDVTATRHVCSASFRARLGDGTVARVLAATAPVGSMFTPAQQQFFSEHAPAGITLEDLCIFGPIVTLKHTHSPGVLGRPLTVELWTHPVAPALLELSTRTPPAETTQTISRWRAFLIRHQITPGDNNWTKTQTALTALTDSPHLCARHPTAPAPQNQHI